MGKDELQTGSRYLQHIIFKGLITRTFLKTLTNQYIKEKQSIFKNTQ